MFLDVVSHICILVFRIGLSLAVRRRLSRVCSFIRHPLYIYNVRYRLNFKLQQPYFKPHVPELWGEARQWQRTVQAALTVFGVDLTALSFGFGAASFVGVCVLSPDV